jgi:hypothetical protein
VSDGNNNRLLSNWREEEEGGDLKDTHNTHKTPKTHFHLIKLSWKNRKKKENSPGYFFCFPTLPG